MPAKFRDIFANQGVDDDGVNTPTIIVPLHGSNIVALTGGKGIRPVPVGKSSNIKIAEVNRAIFDFVRLMGAEPASPFSADTRIFEIDGRLPGESDVKAGDAKLHVAVLKPRSVKIAIRPVQVRNDSGAIVLHAQVTFDIPKLVEMMNQIWTAQTNIVFELVSSDPILVDD